MAKVIQDKEPEQAAKEEYAAEQLSEEKAKEVVAEIEKKEKPLPKAKKEAAYIECKQSTLMDAISLMDGLLNEVVMTIDEGTGLTAAAMDPANVAMVVLDLKPAAFAAIKGAAKVGVNIHSLKKMLKRAAAEDNVRITFKNPIELVLASKFNKTFELPQIDVSEEKTQKLPGLKHDAVFKIKTALLKEAVKDCGEIADALRFEVKNSKLSVSAKGDMSGYTGEVADLTDVKDCASGFSREYMTKVIEDVASDVTVHLGTEYPILLEYDLGNGSKMSLIVAPRVSND